MGFLSKLFGADRDVKVAAEKVHVNVSNAKQFRRNVFRLVTLYQAVEQGDSRKEVLEEIQMRQKVCEDFGHQRPKNIEEAIKLQEEVK